MAATDKITLPEIGDLSKLNTSAKTDLVSAINELNSDIVNQISWGSTAECRAYRIGKVIFVSGLDRATSQMSIAATVPQNLWPLAYTIGRAQVVAAADQDKFVFCDISTEGQIRLSRMNFNIKPVDSVAGIRFAIWWMI